MTYSEKLNDARWQKKRLEILERAGWRCESVNCESLEKHIGLHIHHKVYLRGRNPWEYEDWQLCALCAACHEVEQELMERAHLAIARFEGLAGLAQRMWRMETSEELASFDESLRRICYHHEPLGLLAEIIVKIDNIAGFGVHRGFQLGCNPSPVPPPKDAVQTHTHTQESVNFQDCLGQGADSDLEKKA